jgi:hypothetical protein
MVAYKILSELTPRHKLHLQNSTHKWFWLTCVFWGVEMWNNPRLDVVVQSFQAQQQQLQLQIN